MYRSSKWQTVVLCWAWDGWVYGLSTRAQRVPEVTGAVSVVWQFPRCCHLAPAPLAVCAASVHIWVYKYESQGCLPVTHIDGKINAVC